MFDYETLPGDYSVEIERLSNKALFDTALPITERRGLAIAAFELAEANAEDDNEGRWSLIDWQELATALAAVTTH